MAFPSIEMFPSAYKATKLYSQLPTDGDGDFTFARSTTATRVNPDKLIETVAIDIPRLDYLDDVCPVLLLEPASTNLEIRSEEFDNAHYTKTRLSVIANQIISPDGAKTADAIIEDLSNNTHDLSKFNFIAVTNVPFTFSIFAKQKGSRNLKITSQSGANFNAVFDLDNGTVTSTTGTSADIRDYGNGWFRCSVTGSPPAGNMGFLINPLIGTVSVYQGDGVSGLYLWGFQIEELSFATSYIKTISTTETRTVDNCSGSGTFSEFTSVEGVLYLKISALSDDLTFRTISINDGTSLNLASIRYNSTSNQIQALYIVGNIVQASLITTVSDITAPHKIALKYKLNDFALWVDGVEVATDSLGSVNPSGTFTQLDFDVGTGSFKFFGKLKELEVFKNALTDAELQALTTL